ncbi:MULTISPECIES: type III secretion system export apparatus subunit SctT [Cupriavidus]|uniref:SctT: non flagellar T3S system conserved inner membrane protein. fliR/mopE/spaR family n=2 Tax=Cupriavidus TaxID=106589 RepID=A0A375FEI9_9BURK|nr:MULTISPECIES: type III secretion system export apparatus subunit SctT [Cupriavidus]MCO4891645.1 type III secretion system export apparatus subunit SctT [Cupriavidus sp. WGtm5]MEC3766934.1 type III secretion system export apparatus subunit SctT [Cupriavidus sp. SS-3]PZX34739.1 type III secretion protein T [Cupriavidus alkaliphilus]SOY59660.1 SctT: non flagellar T3S system conserved inner membrane protein. fliR/mopE/spaR family [Cupriavidus taiwanensis]SOY71059.1 SctT: non flagellar T3S syste
MPEMQGELLDPALLFQWGREVIMPIVMVMPRLLTAFTVLPFLSQQAIPGVARNGIVLAIALFVSPGARIDLDAVAGGLWLVLIFKEAFIGLLLGMAFGLFFVALQMIGELIDFQTGSGNATFFDPVTQQEDGPMENLLSHFGIALFAALGGFIAMTGVIVESFAFWPVMSFGPEMSLASMGFANLYAGTLFSWVVKLAAPILLLLVIVELGFALIARFVPQFDVFQFAQPVKISVAFLMLVLMLAVMVDTLQGFLRPDNILIEMLRRGAAR